MLLARVAPEDFQKWVWIRRRWG